MIGDTDKDAEIVAVNMLEAVRYLADVAAEAGLASVSIELRCVCGSLLEIIKHAPERREDGPFDVRN